MTPEQELDLAMSEPDDGSVIRLRLAFDDSPKTYTYAVARVGIQWYLTGVDGGVGRTWGEFIAWLKRKNANVVSIERATEWENL